MRDDAPADAAPAWIELASEAGVRATRPADHPYNFGFVPGMARLLAAHGGIGPLFGRLFARIMFEPGHLDRREREMIAAVAAAAQDCHYWTQSHAEFLRAEAGDPELVEAIKRRAWRELGSLPPRSRALLEVAEKLSATPTRMTAADWEPLRALGFDDAALLEVAHVVGIFNYLTRLADGFGLALDAGTAEAARSGVPLRRGGA